MISAGFFCDVSFARLNLRTYLCRDPANMQQMIASYLFQNKTCPLPGFGHLYIRISGAEADFTNQLVTAPRQFIHFSDKEINTANLIKYIAVNKRATENEAMQMLKDFSAGLKNKIFAGAKPVLPGIGNFFVDEHGNTIFEQEELPAIFCQPVTAIRVIHPNSEHSMLVGDKETTNTMMSEYFSEEESVRDRWWIWAIVLIALALLVTIIYSGNTNNTPFFGNSVKI